MKRFSLAGDDVQTLVATAISLWHPGLKEAGARVLAILVESSDGTPALNHGGFPVLACISVVSQLDRATKWHDAEMLIDKDSFMAKTREEQLAIIDHELSHVVLKKKRQKKRSTGPGVIERDQYGRPMLKLVKGDWSVGDGFKEVIERHGFKAAEFDNLRRAYSFASSLVPAEKPGQARDG